MTSLVALWFNYCSATSVYGISMPLPDDLVPLPTQPWDKRPDAVPLDVEEVRTALWVERGNITGASKRLKVDPTRLRAMVKRSQYLSEQWNEAREQLMDIAEDVVYDALTDNEDHDRQDGMAKFVLGKLGRARGYGEGSGGVTLNLPKGNMVISWADGSNVVGGENDPEVIEGECSHV